MADDEPQTRLFRAEGRSANDLAKAAEKALKGEGVTVSADPEINVLIVKGAEESVHRATELLKSLDRIPLMVTIEAEISVHDPENEGANKVIDHLRLVTLEDNTASVQFGQQVAVVTGRQSYGSRGSQVVTQNQQTGTLLQATSKVGSNGITVKLNIEKSWLEYVTKSTESEDDSVVNTPTTYTLTTETTLLLESGKSQEITATVSGGTSVREAVIEITASAGTPARKQPSVRENPPSRISSPRSNDSQSRNRSGGGRGGSPAGRGGFGGRSQGPPSTDPEKSADRMFQQFDQDKNGEISGNERERVERLLESLGFSSSEKVTRETLSKKILERIGQRFPGRTEESDSSEDSDKD